MPRQFSCLQCGLGLHPTTETLEFCRGREPCTAWYCPKCDIKYVEPPEHRKVGPGWWDGRTE